MPPSIEDRRGDAKMFDLAEIFMKRPTPGKRIVWSLVCAFCAFCLSPSLTWFKATKESVTNLQTIGGFIVLPTLASIVATMLTAPKSHVATLPAPSVAVSASESGPHAVQVVGLQWLNPLQRKDYSTEWQLLWTLGLVGPNRNDDMVRLKPEKYSTLQFVGVIANKSTSHGIPSLSFFNEKYINTLMTCFHDIYFQDSTYFYNVHTKDRRKWRELAGIHVEYAVNPAGDLQGDQNGAFLTQKISNTFDIGNPNFPTLWSRSTPPDVRVTTGGNDAGFTSLSAAIAYLQAHPTETAWAMNWDAPSFPEVGKINENLVLLVLAGPQYKTEREPLAWIGYPATKSVSEFAPAVKGESPRAVRAWQATMEAAAQNGGKRAADIGYVIHDANDTPMSSDRIGPLAQTLTTELPEFDFHKQSFNTPALLGEMGAGTALTDLALGIAYANHMGKNVLVAGTSDTERPTAVMVVPPAKVRPIDPNKDWFRARGGDAVFLPWWGLRHDAGPLPQGYSR